MDNESPTTEMSDEDFTATLKRLTSHAETQAQKAFQSGDRKQFNLWEYRSSQLNGIMAKESMDDGLRKLKGGLV